MTNQKESHFRTLINTIPDLIWLKDVNGVYLSCNKGFERFFGASEADIVGKTDYDFVDKELADFFREHDQRAMAVGGPSKNEEQITFADDGQKVFLETIKTPMFDTDGTLIGILGIGRNITERVEAKGVTASSEKKFRLAFMTSPDSININRMSDGMYVEVNEGFLRIMGYKREEVIGRTSTELNIWKNPQDRQRLIDGLQADGHVENLSAQFCRADGTILEGLMSAGVIELQGEQCILSITRDITRLKQTEKSLHRSEERFLLAMKASHDGLFDWNLETNEIYYSPAWKRMLGYEDHELPNDFSIWESTTDPEDVKKSWELQQKLITQQIDQFVMEFKMKHKDGHWVDILSRAEAIFDKNGKAIRMIGTHTDITEHKQAVAQLKRQKTQLEQRNRALRQFNYAVSHELKTPLVSIESSLGLIQSSLPPTTDPDLTRVFGYARTAAKQMNHLLDSLQLMFRIDTADNRTEATRFCVLVQDAVDRLTRANKLEGIKVNITGEGPELFGDRDKLVQIWLQLIGNAAKYMGDQQAPVIDIGVEQTAEEVQFFVRDNGMGIEKPYQGKIFGLFDQLDRSADGTGLGLTLIQRIVDYYGGTIRVESEGTGQGSCFYFTLPDVLIDQKATT